MHQRGRRRKLCRLCCILVLSSSPDPIISFIMGNLMQKQLGSEHSQSEPLFGSTLQSVAGIAALYLNSEPDVRVAAAANSYTCTSTSPCTHMPVPI